MCFFLLFCFVFMWSRERKHSKPQLTVVKQLMYFISGLPSRDPCIWSLPRSLRFYHGSHTQYSITPALFIISYNFLAMIVRLSKETHLFIWRTTDQPETRRGLN